MRGLLAGAPLIEATALGLVAAAALEVSFIAARLSRSAPPIRRKGVIRGWLEASECRLMLADCG